MAVKLLGAALARYPANARVPMTAMADLPDMAAYLSEQVMSDLPPAMERFLMVTSLSEHSTGDLANRLCDRADGEHTLRQLEREGFFITQVVVVGGRRAQRVIEARGDYLAVCPYAPRVPYEAWILPRYHDSSFERAGLNRPGLRTNLAALLRRTLQRVRSITEDFHLVLHTSPSTLHPSKNLGYWKTIDDDYHWHIEILPVVGSRARSYTFKEVYYSPVSSETAVKQLRSAKIDG